MTAHSPGFEINDLGWLGMFDQVSANGTLRFRETRPGTLFRGYQIAVSSENAFNFSGVRTWAQCARTRE